MVSVIIRIIKMEKRICVFYFTQFLKDTFSCPAMKLPSNYMIGYSCNMGLQEN